MNKSDILTASAKMAEGFKELQEAAIEYPSLLIYFGTGDDKFAQSLNSFIEAFDPRLDYFRRGITKYADQVLSEQKKERRAKAHEAEKVKKKKRGRGASGV